MKKAFELSANILFVIIISLFSLTFVSVRSAEVVSTKNTIIKASMREQRRKLARG